MRPSASGRRPTVGVVIPTYARPAALRECLGGLAAQTDLPEQVVVVHRLDDPPTATVLDDVDVGRVAVHGPGVVLAMATGSAALGTDVVAFCDDDAIAALDWVARLRSAFEDPRLGALGGRDRLGPPHPEYPPTLDVGRLGRWGRVSGNHHRGAGGRREVAVLKAVNMAFRAEALRFPTGLRGEGAQVHFEVPMCLGARDAGWSVVFDPDLVVDHRPQPRFDRDRRDRPDALAVRDGAFNLTFGLLSVRPAFRRRRAAYGLLVGDAGTPGLVRAAYALVRRDPETVRRLLPSLVGQVAAMRRLGGGHMVRLLEPGAMVRRVPGAR